MVDQSVQKSDLEEARSGFELELESSDPLALNLVLDAYWFRQNLSGFDLHWSLEQQNHLQAVPFLILGGQLYMSRVPRKSS